jgi:hypothetical protein
MNAKMMLVAGLLALASGASSAALAQDDVPGPGGDRMSRMQSMMEAFDQTDDAAERRALMEEHMTLMREQMAEMEDQMGACCAGGAPPDMTAMQEQMGMMHGMMMQMMAQQHMMMRMEEPSGDEEHE